MPTSPLIRPGPAARRGELAQTVEIETPELVSFSYTIAGIGSRVYAAVLDYFICFGLFVLILVALAAVGSTSVVRARSPSEAWMLALLVFAQFFILWGYYVLFEGLADGQTPGKRRAGLRVVADGGYSVTFAAAAVRNLVRIVDMQPFVTYAVGLASIGVSKSGKRLGDFVAGTLVVRETFVAAPTAAPPRTNGRGPVPPSELHTALTDEEFAVLERYVQRRGELAQDRRAVLAGQLAARFRSSLTSGATGDAGRLVHLYDRERDARDRGVAPRDGTGAARERHAIVARGSARWFQFSTRLSAAQRKGLRSLGEAGVRDFVAEYREVAADLARLRTATRGIRQDDVFYVSRLVAGAHNLLYRGERLTLSVARRYLFVLVPREVRRSVWAVLLAAVLVFGPAVIAYTAVIGRPDVAGVFLPPAMLSRAEDGVHRAQGGEGYIPDPQILRPFMASSIIANNVQVTFAVFALGITAGLGTAALLVANGVSIGSVFGLYQSKGIVSLLLAFVAPHGVLELSAVCIAGGGGLLLASAILMPGARTRRRALVENGHRAIRLIAASTMLLVVAGALEGFVSPIAWWPLEGKLAVSGATVVLLGVFLRLGRIPRTRAVRSDHTRANVLALGRGGERGGPSEANARVAEFDF